MSEAGVSAIAPGVNTIKGARTGEDGLEGGLDVGCVQRRRLNERQAVLRCGHVTRELAEPTRPEKEGSGGRECGERRGDKNTPANAFASSVGTARRCLRSLLLPTSMMTMFESAWSRSSFSHRVTLTYVACLEMS